MARLASFAAMPIVLLAFLLGVAQVLAKETTAIAAQRSLMGLPVATSCTSPQIFCSGACVDPTTSANNCGACGRVCEAGGSCVSGQCVSAQQPDLPEDEPLADLNALQLTGLSSTLFNPATVTAKFQLQGATFAADSADFQLSINNAPVSIDPAAVSANEIAITLNLNDGSNEIAFKGYDSVGRPLFLSRRYWAGGNSLEVKIVDGGGAPVLGPVEAVVKLSDDSEVSVSLSTTTGSATVQNVPSRTVLVTAQTSGNRAGSAGGLGSSGVIKVPILSFSAASPVANNDLSQGLAGWTVNAAASIVAHQEGAPVSSAPVSATSNNDVLLTTVGEGPQSLSRTFQTAPDTTSVTVRYRFITSEIPGGFFGSKYNDYFSVTVRSASSGGFVSEINSMNGLGLVSFDSSGATSWRVRSLPVTGGETVQVDVTVANVADGKYDSQVVVDFIEEQKDKVIPSLSWDVTNGGLSLGYTVKEAASSASSTLQTPVQITVSWATGPTYADRTSTIFSYTVPAGTPAGPGPPVPISGPALDADPAGTTHIIASVSESNLASLKDVVINFASTANAGVVPEVMRDIVRDSLRAAGLSAGTIGSTARSPADQARVMFDNLVSGGTVAKNVEAQLKLYAPPGDAVINVFSSRTQGLTYKQILADAASIKAAMLEKIMSEGPINVSKHCGDPTKISVVDLGKSQFGPSSGARFAAAAKPRCSVFLDEQKPNNAFHLQLNLS